MMLTSSFTGSLKESLKLFKADNFKLFLLVTLKSFKELYKVIFYALLVIAIFMALVSIPIFALYKVFGTNLFISILVKMVFLLIYSALLIWLSRPSVAYKNVHYVMQLLTNSALIVLTVILSSFISMLVYLAHYLNQTTLCYMLALISFILFPLVSLVYLFLYDSPPHEKKKIFIKAFKMFVYNYPFFFFTSASFYILLKIICFIVHAIQINIFLDIFYYILLGVLLLVILPFFICWITNFYVKRLHDQFLFYFPDNYGKM